LTGAFENIDRKRLSEYLNAIPEQWQSGTDGATRIVAYIEQLKEHLKDAMTEMARILA